MDSLKSSKCIKILEDGFTLEPTFLGQLASFYYIKHETIFEFDKKLSADVSIPELIRIISYAKEFEEVPLRHNEENMNEELAKSCPLSCNKKAFDNPNEKTYLLFQAHLFRLPLPIRDYVTDTKIVIDSSIRIIHSLIDLAAEKMYLKTTLNLTLLMQMIIQGCWFDKSALTNVPHFTPEIIKKLD
jgi:activating signal cointegrator complex subunit 3